MHVFIKGKEIQIDEDDLHILDEHKWFWGNHGYLLTKIQTAPRKRRTVALHRLIMEDPPYPLVVDHINRDKSDNRKCNLRACTQAENLQNKGRYNVPGKGVTFNRGKWRVIIKINGKAKWFGHYDTKDEALIVAQNKFKELAA